MNSVFKNVRFFEETNPNGQMNVNFKFWNEIYKSLNRKQREEFFLSLLSYASADEMKDIKTLYKKPMKKEVAYSEEIDI